MTVYEHPGFARIDSALLASHLTVDAGWKQSGTAIVALSLKNRSGSDDAFRYDVEWRAADSSHTELVLDARTLRPMHARYESRTGVNTLAYEGDAFTELDTLRDIPGVDTSRASVPAEAYNSVSLPLVVRALPLALGYRTRVLVSFPFRRRTEMVPVWVAGRDRVKMRSGQIVDCWRVWVFDGRSPVWFWVSTDSHEDVLELSGTGQRSQAMIMK